MVRSGPPSSVRMMNRASDIPGAPPRWIEVVLVAGVWLLVMAVALIYRALDPAVFMRIHRSIIVRLDAIDAMHTSAGGDYAVQLRDGVRLKVARGRREELVERLRGGG